METRGAKYGKNYAALLSFVLSHFDESYKKSFIDELMKYSFEPRKKNQPRNSGCVFELDGIGSIDMGNPRHLAKLVKEGLHIGYQKNTARRTHESLVSSLRQR